MDFFTLLHQKSDKKKSYINNLNNTIEDKIFCFNCYQVKE